MACVPVSFQAHALVVLVLLAIWPYTRLVHVFSAPPLGYLVRPYVVYRSRDVHPGTRRYARVWEQPTASDGSPRHFSSSLGVSRRK